jgi:hypothetical protein
MINKPVGSVNTLVEGGQVVSISILPDLFSSQERAEIIAQHK